MACSIIMQGENLVARKTRTFSLSVGSVFIDIVAKVYHVVVLVFTGSIAISIKIPIS
jgi:hypothetical protein